MSTTNTNCHHHYNTDVLYAEQSTYVEVLKTHHTENYNLVHSFIINNYSQDPDQIWR
jgi:hypothetical protein